MSETWQWFLVVGGGLILFVNIINALIELIKFLKYGKKNADAFFEGRVRGIITIYRNEELIRETTVRQLELSVLREFIVNELRPIKNDISDIKTLNTKLHHAQMTDLQIKLSSIFHEKFDKRGILNKVEQANWDKWFSDYTALDGNSDIKKMDDLIQKARIEAALDKARILKTTPKKEETSHED